MSESMEIPTPATDMSQIMLKQVMDADKLADDAHADANTAEGFGYGAMARQIAFFMANMAQTQERETPHRELTRSIETIKAKSEMDMKNIELALKQLELEEKQHDFVQKQAKAQLEIEKMKLDLDQTRAQIEQTKKGHMRPVISAPIVTT